MKRGNDEFLEKFQHFLKAFPASAVDSGLSDLFTPHSLCPQRRLLGRVKQLPRLCWSSDLPKPIKAPAVQMPPDEVEASPGSTGPSSAASAGGHLQDRDRGRRVRAGASAVLRSANANVGNYPQLEPETL